MKSRRSAPRRTARGVALIITLFFLVLVSIVVIGFIGTARVDRVAAGSHFERMRAQTLASEGIQAVMATLQRETCDVPYDSRRSDYIPRNWISGPGMLEVTDSDPTHLVKKVLLSSGAPSAPYLAGTSIDLVMRPPNLNIELLVDQSTPTHLLTEQHIDPNSKDVVKMPVRWVYVRQDGTYDIDAADGLPTEAPNTSNTANPIIGRFAYWADDESAKINYNLAWTRDTSINPNPPGDPTHVDLRALPNFTDKIANNLHGFITTDNYATVHRFFNSPFDARLQADDEMRQALDLNKFNLTHYNSDPDSTYYGLSRMMLTTQLKNAVMRDAAGNAIFKDGKPLTRPFLDILKNPSQNVDAYIDPGITGTASTTPGVSNGNIDPVKLNTVINDLVNNYLKRNDWPMVDVFASIQDKYYNLPNYPKGTVRDQRLAQVALDIIDYVRSAESQLTVVQPIRAKWLGIGGAATFTPDFANQTIQGTDDTFKGLTRAPHITEMSMWVSPTPETINQKSFYRTVVLVEVYLPTNYGISQLDLSATDGKQWQLYFDEMNPTAGDPVLYYRSDGTTPAATESKVLVPYDPKTSQAFVWETRADPANGAILKAGQYRTFAMEVWRTKSVKDLGTARLRAAITLAGGPRIDVAPLATPLTFTLDADAPTEMDVTSYETADPRVNGVTLDWVLNSGSSGRKNTFGSENRARTASLATPITNAIAPQDLDAQGRVSTESMRMPPPYDPKNPATGRVRSAGELGLIHTGVEGSNTVKKSGTPWRSLHLQPSTAPASVVPDWAFMDLFTVPGQVPVPVAAAGMFNPHGNSAGGRVNVNAKPDAFDIQRMDPLVAVLLGAQTSTLNTNTLDANAAKQIATNIYNHTLAPSTGSAAKGKLYPSSPTGPNVYESPGEIVEIAGVADRGEESEQLIREIGNLITARGNTFAVYTVGQSLKQTSAGKLIITGEQRQEAMIERYQISKGTPTLDDDVMGLRTVYFRNLTP